MKTSMDLQYIREDGTLSYEGQALFAEIDEGVSGKQDTLISGTNIKTVNGVSLLGSGDVDTNLEVYGVLQSGYVLTSTTAYQRMFNWSANGAVTLPTGVYSFEVGFTITGMSATSGNAAFGILGAGTATLANTRYGGVTADTNATILAGTMLTLGQPDMIAGTNMAVAATNTNLVASLIGTFDVTATGTLIPSIALVTAAAATVAAGSFFRCRRIGDTGAATRGNWS